MHQLPAQVIAPLRHRRCRHLVGQRREKPGHRQVQLLQLRHALRCQVAGPVDGRRLFVERGEVAHVVDGVRIALLFHRHRRGCEPRFQRHHRVCRSRGRRRRVAQQPEHARDVLFIALADGAVLRIVLEIVVAIGHTQATLPGHGNNPGAVRKVLHLAQAEGGVYADELQVGKCRGQVGGSAQRGNARKFRLERLNTGLLHASLVHTAGVEVADLLLLAAMHGGLVRGGRLQQPVNLILVAIIEHRGLPPAGIGWRNRVVANEFTVGVQVEINQRIDAAIHPRRAQRADAGRGILGRRNPACQDETQRGTDCCSTFHCIPRCVAR